MKDDIPVPINTCGMAGTEGSEVVAFDASAVASESCSSTEVVLGVAFFAETGGALGAAERGVSPLTSDSFGSMLTFSPFTARLWYFCPE